MMFAIVLAFVFVINSVAGGRDFYFPDELSSAVKKHNGFEWALTKSVLKDQCEECNVIISPILIKILLSMVEQGATEKSKQELLSTLYPEIHIDQQLTEYWSNILQSLEEKTPQYEVFIASQIYIQKSFSIKSTFIEMIKKNYHTNLEVLDFSDVEKSASHINKWVSKKTQNHIHDMINSGDIKDTVALFLSAVYFKGLWDNEFSESYIKDFKISSQKSFETQFMENTDNYLYQYSKALNSKIVRLGYKGNKYAMYIILPNDVDGLNDVMDKLNSTVIDNELNQMHESRLMVGLPKFEFDHTIDLESTLQNLGIKAIFTNGANLTKISDQNNLKVTSIIQKAGISVDKYGTVAYGAANLGIGFKFGAENFIVNHPFIFFIEDETTGTLLFAGKVSNPKVEK